MQQTELCREILVQARQKAETMHHEFITPEHILYACLQNQTFAEVLNRITDQTAELEEKLENYLTHDMEQVPDEFYTEPEISEQTSELINRACFMAHHAESSVIDITHLVQALFSLEESQANYLLQQAIDGQEYDLLMELVNECDDTYRYDNTQAGHENMDEYGEIPEDEYDGSGPANADPRTSANSRNGKPEQWRNMVMCLNEHIKEHNPLIGREEELEQTIRVLCRRDKNNPLHVGEPGVGKTALAYGLAARIAAGDVPERLKGSHIYALNLGSLVSGTKYRGEFEKRLKTIIEGIAREGNAIIYIDEFHNLVGTGRTGEGSLDASDILKPYMESGELRFMGATTYDEYNRFLSQSKGLMRRFQEIKIAEPSVSDCIGILKGLQSIYEEYHHVTCEEGLAEYIVTMSARYIKDRFLPDKAIDLLDEAGAYCELHHKDNEDRIIGKALINEILARICKIDTETMKEDTGDRLAHLQQRIKNRIFGQQEAVEQVSQAVLMAKAGLTDDNKPVASLLFVGPTGVGKTEVAKVLAQELGIGLLRFDMSEYTEKHTVAKLIGSPAGYVGYDDGGLLTDALRKTPHCVLLLDEIEKAHPDIFNILLQVMDYGTLTDNKGRKSDCRHLILIMTSNAGAQHAHQASIGFGKQAEAGVSMMKQVKQTFKPEFLNRLSATVIFHDMNEDMAHSILNKKLGELTQKLAARQVQMEVDTEAWKWLLEHSITREYGAREMDRTLATYLKPLLAHEILFGKLKHGGKVLVQLKDNHPALHVNEETNHNT